MIEILDPSEGESIHTGHMDYEDIRARIGGYLEIVHIREGGKIVQVVCNEDGHMLRLPRNHMADIRFKGTINMGPGAVGVYMVLSGGDKLT
jgi:hypothetical protein